MTKVIVSTNILFSDEANFYLNGVDNRQNYCFWSQENPHWTYEAHTQRPQKVNVWAGIINNRILGPYFFKKNLTAESYLDLFSLDIVPALTFMFPNEVDPDILTEIFWFQQDGAPPHFGINVREYLDICRTLDWTRSPDFTPLDYFLCGYLKHKVRIRVELSNITAEVIRNSIDGFYHRLVACQVKGGGHFQDLLR